MDELADELIELICEWPESAQKNKARKFFGAVRSFQKTSAYLKMLYATGTCRTLIVECPLKQISVALGFKPVPRVSGILSQHFRKLVN